MKTRQEKLSKDLENKWADTLKRETMRVRHEISQQKDEERKAAIAQLARTKDEETSAMKRGWEKKVEDLLAEVTRNEDMKTIPSCVVIVYLCLLFGRFRASRTSCNFKPRLQQTNWKRRDAMRRRRCGSCSRTLTRPEVDTINS